MVLSGVDMRIVSQNGIVDVPYEHSAITCIDGVVRAEFGGDTYVLAEYKNPDVAMLETKIMRKSYMESCKYVTAKIFTFSEDPGI